MRLYNLTIHGFRAFPPEEHSIDFEGNNSVIVGDNGTGKSSVLAALEFLLTGGMSHLSGPGTGDIDIPSYAPHQWADPRECYVRGEFVNDDGERGLVERRADNHTDLELIEGDISADNIEISQWNDEHLILTRGQLLDFIESAPGNRGEQLSKLLNLSGVSNRASGFNRIRNYLDDEAELKRSICERQVDDIDSAANLGIQFPLQYEDEDSLVDEVNDKLTALGGNAIEGLDDLNAAIETIDLVVAEAAIDPLYESSTETRLDGISTWISERAPEFEDGITDLAENLAELEVFETESLYEVDFFDAALDIIDRETTVCPVCGEVHDEGYLMEQVQEERDRLSRIRELRNEIQKDQREQRRNLREHQEEIQELIERLERGLESGDHSEVEREFESVQRYLDEISAVEDVLAQDLIQEREDVGLEIDQINPDEISPDWSEIREPVETILDYLDDLEPLERRSQTYGDLVSINNSWNTLEEENEELEKREELVEEMELIIDLYSEAREESLEALYSDVEEMFNEYYETIHPDEQEIDLDFNAEGTDSVNLIATFQDERDNPLAYHSEGHIDTMGICLFLALRNHLNTSGPDIVMLDDIVMAIDRTHRQGIVRLLSEYLEGSPQGILATHDEVWADQLTESNIVPRNNVLEITDWDISTGPMLKTGAWEIVEEYLDDNRPHAAAAHLRRQAEKLSRIAASTLKPPIEYKERYSLADFVFGISGRIKTVAKGAKRQFDDNSDEWEAAQDLDDHRVDLFGDVGFDEMNNMVHYRRDEWGQLSVEDLREVVEHWREIEQFLFCDECQSFLSYNDPGDWSRIECDGRHVSVGFEP